MDVGIHAAGHAEPDSLELATPPEDALGGTGDLVAAPPVRCPLACHPFGRTKHCR